MYRTIDTSIWNDPRFYQLAPLTKLLAIYLFSNDRAHFTGLYFFSKLLASDELGLDLAETEQRFDELCAAGFCQWDASQRVVWVVNMWKRQPHQGVHYDRLPRYFATLNGSRLVSAFQEKYAHDPHLSRIRTGTNRSELEAKANEPERTSLSPLERDRKNGKEEGVPPLKPPPSGGSDNVVTIKVEKPVKPKASHDLAEVEKALGNIDLQAIAWKYPNKDVGECWEEFYEVCTTGTAKKDWPNPYDYTSFPKAFHNWLKKRPDRKSNIMEVVLE